MRKGMDQPEQCIMIASAEVFLSTGNLLRHP